MSHKTHGSFIMSKSLYPFGRVLLDELEQIAVRRGGFASLQSVHEELCEAQRQLKLAIEHAKNPDVPLRCSTRAVEAEDCRPRSVFEKALEEARRARKALASAAQAVEAIEELCQLGITRVKTAQQVIGDLESPPVHSEDKIPFKALTDLLAHVKRSVRSWSWAFPWNAAFRRWFSQFSRPTPHSPRPPSGWEELLKVVQDKLGGYEQCVQNAHKALRKQEIIDESVERKNDDWFERVCRAARGLPNLDQLKGDDRNFAEQTCGFLAPNAEVDSQMGRAIEGWSPEERLLRGGVVKRSQEFTSALKRAADQFDMIIFAYKELAQLDEATKAAFWRLIGSQSAASRYEIYDVLEDGARKGALRLGTIGLAFSGGGIRSATFNLGFLQGMASLGLLKQFDYISTVSGGGYIGAWFAAWVRREAGHTDEPKAITESDVDSYSDTRINEFVANLPTAFIDPRLREATAKIRADVKARLEQELPTKLDANGGRKDLNGADPPRIPDEADIDRESASLIAQELERIQEEARKLVTPAYIIKQVQQNRERIRNTAKLELDQEREKNIRAKRRRTAQAMANVEKQLNSRRDVQRQAERRWVSPDEISDGREATTASPSLLRRVVDEEPEPVYHLRAYSNYLAPRVGLLSADTWTMFSVYLRNLLLNQFILLPMMLAAVAVPRLLLLFFGRSSSGAPRPWLEQSEMCRAFSVWVAALLAVLVLPKPLDVLALGIAKRVGKRVSVFAILAPVVAGLMAMGRGFTAYGLSWLYQFTHPGAALPSWIQWLKDKPWTCAGAILLTLIPAAALLRQRVGALAGRYVSRLSTRVKGWMLLLLVIQGLATLSGWLLPWVFEAALTATDVLTSDIAILFATFWLTCFASHSMYSWVSQIRKIRQPVAAKPVNSRARSSPPFPNLWTHIIIPFTLSSFGVSLLFSQPNQPYFVCPVPGVGDWFKPATWGDRTYMPAILFGLLVGLIRLGMYLIIETKDRRNETKDRSNPLSRREMWARGASAFAAGLVSCTALAAVLSWLNGQFVTQSGELAALMMSFGPMVVIVAVGAGSAIEVGLIGKYGEEDMREWRASLGAYLLMIGCLWTGFSLLAVYGPLLLAITSWGAPLAGSIWVFISAFGALAGGSAKTNGVKTSRSRLEYVAVIAPPVFIIGLVIAVSMLATVLQGVAMPVGGQGSLSETVRLFLNELSQAEPGWTWAVLLASAGVATIGCVYVNVNLFALNAFYANRLVRCYLGASRPREAPPEGRPNFAPTNSPVPVRRPNPITGFDPTDDFPIRDLSIVRTWGRDDLVVDYPGPYHLVNTAMNLVAGSELAWQERMAESFLFSPLYCGSKTTGYRPTHITKGELPAHELEFDEVDVGLKDEDEVPGYGDNVRLGTAVSVSGAAASPNSGYHSSPLVTILMTVFNARLGLWFGNPARDAWRRSGPGFAIYLFDELFGRTTSKGKYVYLSDGGHFENLGAYELVRRRCRFVVLCDAGADPELSFWDLGNLVRKCREDFGVRIEIDLSPLLKREGTVYSQWHCAVGRIHYEDVDVGATPGTLFYIKPSLTGDESSDVRNYVVDHPTFPHESTADQFFSESQFESYRVLGEHIGVEVFRDVKRDAGADRNPASLFSRLRRRWFPPPPNLDKNFIESVKPFVEVHHALRTEANLERISHELYPELSNLAGGGSSPAPTPTPGAYRAEMHAVIEMLQAMENAWLSVDLDAHSDHPLNRGWMNVFRRWTSSSIFQTHWPAVRGEYSEGFVRFCENELNLTVPPPRVLWLEASEATQPGSATVTAADFRLALKELDKEFALEWPDIVLPEIGDKPSHLADMFEYALKYPPLPNQFKCGLIVPDRTTAPTRPTTEPPHYGVILVWASSDDLTELVIWLRGAYRTLGFGRSIKDAIDALKANLEKNLAPRGYTLRSRYPNPQRNRSKQRWQGTLWIDFYQNQGFHRDGNADPDGDMDSLIYQYDPH